MNSYILLAIAIVLGVIADNLLKLSDGLRRKAPVLLAAIPGVLEFWILGLVLEELPLGFTYGAWTALNIVLMCVSGVVIWKEKFSVTKIIGIVCVIAGVALMRSVV